LFRWCGLAGILGGVLLVAWGYMHMPESTTTVVRILALVVPALLLAVVVGLFVLWGRRLGVLGRMGTVVAVCASGWGIVKAIVGSKPMWMYFEEWGWPHFLSNFLLWMLPGLTLMGIAMVRSGLSRGGALVLVTAVSGWVYYLTDSGIVLEAPRSVHIVFGLLFGLGWVAFGVGLLAAGTRRARRP